MLIIQPAVIYSSNRKKVGMLKHKYKHNVITCKSHKPIFHFIKYMSDVETDILPFLLETIKKKKLEQVHIKTRQRNISRLIRLIRNRWVTWLEIKGAFERGRAFQMWSKAKFNQSATIWIRKLSNNAIYTMKLSWKEAIYENKHRHLLWAKVHLKLNGLFFGNHGHCVLWSKKERDHPAF